MICWAATKVSMEVYSIFNLNLEAILMMEMARQCFSSAFSFVYFLNAVAIEAIHLNCELNSVTIATSLDDLIGSQSRGNWEVVFLGDMFYDEEFTDRVHEWTRSLSGSSIFIGDPGRLFLENHPLKKELNLVHRVELPDSSKEENYGFTEGYVWEIVNR